MTKNLSRKPCSLVITINKYFLTIESETILTVYRTVCNGQWQKLTVRTHHNTCRGTWFHGYSLSDHQMGPCYPVPKIDTTIFTFFCHWGTFWGHISMSLKLSRNDWSHSRSGDNAHIDPSRDLNHLRRRSAHRFTPPDHPESISHLEFMIWHQIWPLWPLCIIIFEILNFWISKNRFWHRFWSEGLEITFQRVILTGKPSCTDFTTDIHSWSWYFTVMTGVGVYFSNFKFLNVWIFENVNGHINVQNMYIVICSSISHNGLFVSCPYVEISIR